MRRLLGYRRGIRETPSASDEPLDPNTIPNLRHWFDASDAATITLGLNGVQDWADKATGSTDKMTTNGVATNEPSYITNGWNGLNYIDFNQATDQVLTMRDAASALLLLGSSFGAGNYSYTLVAVTESGAPNATFTDPNFWSGSGVLNARGYWGFMQNGAASPFDTYAAAYSQGPLAAYVKKTGIASGGKAIQIMSFTDPGVSPATGDMTFRYNRATVGSVSKQRIWAAFLTNSAYGIRAGQGGPGAGARLYTGKLAEWMLWQRELNASEMASVEAYLQAKWGTP